VSQQINLYNPLFGKKKRTLSALMIVQGLGLVAFCALLLVVYANHQVMQTAKLAAAATTQLGVVQARLSRVSVESAPRPKSAAIENDIRSTEAEIASLHTVTAILKKGDFGNAQGYSSYLRAFARQSIDGLWLTGLSIHAAGKEIGLQGRVLQAALVPAYINRLATEPALSGKFFTGLQMRVPSAQLAPGTSATPGKPEALNYIEFSLLSKQPQPDDATPASSKGAGK
jgi:hypothetical protein